MSFSDFSLKKVKTELKVKILEKNELFSSIEDVEISDILKGTLEENVPLAIAVVTEKARSELIVSPVLVEVRKRLDHRISIFSGIELNADEELGLNGFCDFIISLSPTQLMLTAPVVTIVEAKNDNIMSGIGQCIAEMVAARIFNENEYEIQELEILPEKIYGVVTTGTAWQFMQLEKNTVSVDMNEYPIHNPEKIVGILSAMVEQRA